MRKQTQMKKGIAALLSGVLAFGMTAGIVPAIPGNPKQVEAAAGEPSVTAYATKAQLMDSTFAPDADGNANNTGKLVFGKNSTGTAQEWYILGQDSNLNGENTIIFASNPIAKDQVFSTDLKNKEYTYTDGESAVEVWANHYGASELRKVLQDMTGADNTNYFSAAEKSLMQETTVKSISISEKEREYTVSDKLYAPTGRYGSAVISVGNEGSLKLSARSYWSSGNRFWLSYPITASGDDELYVDIENKVVQYGHADGTCAVRPATNLNLSSVLFASAAKAATSDTTVSDKIAEGTAMTLRLNGNSKIGTVTYNAAAGQINAKKGSITDAVALVVQGNDGTKDWYYSKQISGTDNVIVNAADIAAESNTPSDIDLTNCKIWLEVTEDRVSYAVEATATTEVAKTSISSVEITGVEAPVSNTALDTSAVCATKGVSTTKPAVTWTPGDAKAGYNTSYTASVTLTASANYQFSDSATATVNGNNADVTKNENGTLTVTYTFPATAKDKLKSITAPDSITVANGTAYKDMNLPTQVNIVTEGNTVDKADVTWDTASGNYDPSVLTEQIVTLKGTVTCPKNIDANGVALTAKITITVNAAGIVGAPTTTVGSGTYIKNQTVALASSTKGATIYYTTDGSKPDKANGKKYTGPISVTGTEGKSVTTTIKAVAVKDGMKDSEVKTFTYTIEIPKSVAKHTITATAGANGSISPSGKVKVTEGDDQTFSIKAKDGYEIASLKVDGKTVSTATSYTFKNVTEAHTIEVTFKQKETPVQPTVKKPGISKQPQNVSVKAGKQATFTVKATGTDLTYQWQINRNNGKGFVDITGADKASYTTGVVDMLCNGYKYQCVISNDAGSVTTNTATLTVTENKTPSPDPEPASYKILDGANSSWTENTDGSLTIRGNGEMENFQNVKVDGKIVDKKNYTVTKGSTIITLKADYLKTLATGDHTFEIVWTDGSATTNFTVAKNKSGDNNNNNKNNQTTQNNPTDTKKAEQSVTAPKTGDTSNMTLWTTLLLVSFAGAAGIVVRRNKKACK